MYIQLNGQVIQYEKSGSGPPLFLLHGNGEDHHIFDELVPELTDLYTVYAVDTRGHGGSATPSEFHYVNMMLDISRMITALDLDQVLVCGFSDGGIMALMLGILHSDMLSGIIACGANRSPKGLTRKAYREIRSHYRKTRDPLYRLMLEEPHITDRELGRIRVPVLLLAGEHDMIREEETRAMEAAIPDARAEILPGEDHGSYVIHSTKLAPYLRRFAHDTAGDSNVRQDSVIQQEAAEPGGTDPEERWNSEEVNAEVKSKSAEADMESEQKSDEIEPEKTKDQETDRN